MSASSRFMPYSRIVFVVFALTAFSPALFGQPNFGPYKSMECSSTAGSPKDTIQVFQDVGQADLFYYLPTHFHLSQRPEGRVQTKDRVVITDRPAVSLVLHQDTPESGTMEEYGEFSCSFDFDLINTDALEKVEKEVKRQFKLKDDLGFLPMPIEKAMVTFFDASGKKFFAAPAEPVGTSEIQRPGRAPSGRAPAARSGEPGTNQGQRLVVQARLDKEQSDLITKKKFFVVFQVQFKGIAKGVPIRLDYDEGAVIKLLGKPKASGAFLHALLTRDAKAGISFYEQFIKNKTIEAEIIAGGNLNPQEKSRIQPLLLFKRLKRHFTLELPDTLPKAKADNLEKAAGKTFSEIAVLQPRAKSEKRGKIRMQGRAMSSLDALAIGTADFFIGKVAKNVLAEIVTVAKSDFKPSCELFLPRLNPDPVLGLKEVTAEFTALDGKKQKIARPVVAAFDFPTGSWKNAEGKVAEIVSLDLTEAYDKIKSRLEECSIQVRYSLSQDFLGKPFAAVSTREYPLFLGECAISHPLDEVQRISLNWEFAPLDDLTGIAGTITQGSGKKIAAFELPLKAETKWTHLLLDQAAFGNGEIDVAVQFTAKNGTFTKEYKDVMNEFFGEVIIFPDEDLMAFLEGKK